MKKRHPEDFEKYYDKLYEIIKKPDFVNLNPKDNSIRYLKILDDCVVVGVRVSSNGVFYARTLFTYSDEKFKKQLEAGYLIKVWKKEHASACPFPKNLRQGDIPASPNQAFAIRWRLPVPSSQSLSISQ